MHRLVLVIALILLAVDVRAKPQLTPRQVTKRLGDVFITGTERLRNTCDGQPLANLSTVTLLKNRYTQKDASRVRVVLRDVLQQLIRDQQLLFWDSLRASPRLAAMKKIRLDVGLDDSTEAYADPDVRGIHFSIGLIRFDFVETLGSAAPMCVVFFPNRYPAFGKARITPDHLNTVSAGLHFVLKFQVLHEVAHVLLEHNGQNQRCEELEADRFAVDYLHSIRDVLFAFPRPDLPLGSTWPATPPDEEIVQTHPARTIREDQVSRTLALREAAFSALVPPDKLSLPGAIIGTAMLDADVYQAHFALQQSLKTGSSCHTM